MVKQLKNRYNEFLSMNKRFVVGIDRARMKLYDCEQEAQDDIIDSGQDEGATFDKTTFGVGLGKTRLMRNFRTSKYKNQSTL